MATRSLPAAGSKVSGRAGWCCRPLLSAPRRLVIRSQAPPFVAPAPAAAAAVDEAAPAPAAAAAVDEAAPAPAPASGPPGQGYSSAVLLQGFAWDSWKNGKGNWYGNVKGLIPDIKAAGITHVWLPPPSASVSNEGYLPGQLYDLSSKYGNEEQLRDLTTALRAEGVTPLADIVINHRCADDKEDGVYNNFKDNVDHVGANIDWGRWAITNDDPVFKGTGNPDTGDDYPAAPDLDHANPDLRAALKDWMGWLQKDLGFQGWRFDYVRGFGSEFIQEYVDATTGADALNVGELWTDAQWSGPDLEYNQDGPRQQLCDWIKGNGERCTAFDFPTKSILQEAAKNCQYDRLRDSQGKAPGLLGWWPGKTVTFLENHDTGSTQQHWPFPSEHVGLGYAYILTHPGVPCIFWDHLFTWGDDMRNTIITLAALRRRAGIVADSPMEVLVADADLYMARIGGSVTVKLGPRVELGSLLPAKDDGWALVMAGQDWAVWERAGGAAQPQ